MKKLNANNTRVKDRLLYFFILASTIVFFVMNSVYSLTSPLQIMLWCVWLLSVSAMFFFTESGQWVISFSKEARIELAKVIWPSRQETVQVTMLVMAMVVAASFILWTCDSLIFWAVAKITHLG